MPDGCIATSTSRRCTSTSCRRSTTRGIRFCSARAAATSGSATRPRAERRLASAAQSGHESRLSVRDLTGPMGRCAEFTSVCAPVVYRGDRLPADLYGNVFVAEPAANLVSRLVLKDARRARCARARPTNGVSSWPRPTSGSGRCISPTRRTARCTSWTCIAGCSSSGVDMTEYLRDHIVRSKLEEPHRAGADLSRRARDDASATRRRPCRRRRRRSWCRRCRIRMAGGATRRSGCSSSAADRGVVPALDAAGRGAPRIRARASTRCGRSTASMRSSRRSSRGARRRVTRRARVGGATGGALARRAEASVAHGHAGAHRRSGLGGAAAAGGVARRAAGWPARARRWRRCSTAHAARSGRRWTPRSAACAAASCRCSSDDRAPAARRRRSATRRSRCSPRPSCAVRQETAVQSLFDAVAAAPPRAVAAFVAGVGPRSRAARRARCRDLRRHARQRFSLPRRARRVRADAQVRAARMRTRDRPGQGRVATGSRPVLRLNREPAALTRLTADGDLTARVSRCSTASPGRGSLAMRSLSRH